MNRKAYDVRVRELRKHLPEYNNGRKVVVLNQYTERGKRIIASARCYEGTELWQVYNSPSREKQSVFKELWSMFCQSPDSHSFAICSHNTFSFTVTWCEPGYMYFFTPVNEYIVVIDE